MAIKCPDTFATAWSLAWYHASRRSVELPHLDRLVETAADQISAVWRKSHAVHAILVTHFTLETLNQEATAGVPDTDALIKRTGSHETVVRGDCDSRDTVVNEQ